MISHSYFLRFEILFIYTTVAFLILAIRLSTALQLSQCMNLMLRLTEHLPSKVRITFSSFYRHYFYPLSSLLLCYRISDFCYYSISDAHNCLQYLNCSSKEARLQLECGTHNRSCQTREAEMHIFNISKQSRWEVIVNYQIFNIFTAYLETLLLLNRMAWRILWQIP
jgi:hypothetical protein